MIFLALSIVGEDVLCFGLGVITCAILFYALRR